MVAWFLRGWGRPVRTPGSGHTSMPRALGSPPPTPARSADRYFLGAATPHVLEEGVRQQHQHDVVIPAPPRPALQVVQAQLVLELAVAVFHPPAALGRGHQP